MEAMNALTPNTAAFLESLTSSISQPETGGFPPSAFFPVPGRDTPVDSSPSSIGDKVKPIVSDDSDHDSPVNNHKRKANKTEEDHDEDDDDDDESDGGHEDKRHEPNKGNGRRKSNDKAKGGAAPKDNLTKAQRRKEQNRAAQKAFRERREAKVRDLEEKVAELEAKSYGASVENENLRGILRRLQEENMALKQAHFTFSMPVGGATADASRQQQQQQSPTARAPAPAPASTIDWSSFANFKAQPQVTKPPSPPQSVNGNLRSINDPSPAHRTSIGSGSDNSPESLVPINGPSPSSSSERSSLPTLFSNGAGASPHLLNRFNAATTTTSPTDTQPTPGTNNDDVEALLRSMYPSGIEAVLGNATNATSYNASGLANSTGPQPLSPTSQQTPYTFLSTQQGLTSFADSSSNSLAKLFGDATSYRDTGASLDSGVNNTGPSFTHNTTATINGPLASQAPWFSLTENSVTEFLASQTGTNNTDPDATADDDLFSRQIQALISAQSGGASPSAQFNIPNSAFSPTTYLNMSPSPLQSLSSSQTPQSTVGTSSVTSPQTDAEDAVCGVSKVIHVVGEDGRVMRPSEVWTKMGMHNTAEPGELLIDDLCDQMRSKATCKDGRRYMKYDDVKDMVKTREDHGSSRFGDRAQTPAKEPQVVAAAAATAAAAAATGPEAAAAPGPKKKCGGKGYHDPAECQARLNAAFVEANGGL